MDRIIHNFIGNGFLLFKHRGGLVCPGVPNGGLWKSIKYLVRVKSITINWDRLFKSLLF